MICPHCYRTIREEQRYLMSRAPAGEPVETPPWLLKTIGVVVAFLLIVAYLTANAG